MAKANAPAKPLTTTQIVSALAAGVVASFVASALMLLLRLVAGIVTLPEILGERILPNLDASTFVSLLVRFGKIEPLITALAGQIVLGIVIAPLYPLIMGMLGARLGGEPLPHSRWHGYLEYLAAAIIAGALWVVALALFWPVLPENLLGFPLSTARIITIFGLAAIFTFYAFTLAVTYRVLTRARVRRGAGNTSTDLTRRVLLVRAGVVSLAGLLAGGAVVDLLLRALAQRSNLGYEGMRTLPPISAITPTSQFYIVSKNVLDPQVVVANWRLDVGGLVRHPGSYDLASIQRLNGETRPITLECISNTVGGQLLSTAIWHGVTLEHLLEERGGVLPHGSHVLFTSVDGYQSSLPLADLLEVRTLLAWQMNGARLTDRHGFPLRVVVPGRFGEQSPKWLTRIEILDHATKGFYQRQGWYDGPVYTISRIDHPRKDARLAARHPVQVRGVAYAGARGIATVEVSTDAGITWRPATLDSALSQETWALWTYMWIPDATGQSTLIVRATDGTGATQITREQSTVPNGATGLHQVTVMVV